MSTNYYVNEPVCDCPCPHCTAPENPHIGKLSGGWEFMFSSVHGPKSWKEWKEYLLNGPTPEVADPRESQGSRIRARNVIDEFGVIHTPEEFIKRVESTRRPGATNQTKYVNRSRTSPPHDHDLHSLDAEGWSFTNSDFC